MPNQNYVESALFEHRFWLQVLGDHARFLLMTLGPIEEGDIQKAHSFLFIFDDLLVRARRSLSETEVAALNQEVYHYAEQMREFKLSILRRQLEGKMNINLPPTFINHMVNEIEEYLRILCSLLAGNLPPACHPLHYHLVWLPDAAGHAASINSSSDPVEKTVKMRGEAFTKHFEQLYVKAVELAGYMRTNLQQFPALSRFNREVALEMQLFTQFLNEIEELELTHELLGTLSPLMPDHMAREECYYLTKLAQASETNVPPCDPTKPRVSKKG
jgi:hypothetical protein